MDSQIVKFIFFNPFSEKYYEYAINGVEKTNLVERMEAHTLLSKATPKIMMEAYKAISEYRSFIVDVETEQILYLGVTEKDREKVLKSYKQINQVNPDLKIHHYDERGDEENSRLNKITKRSDNFLSKVRSRIHSEK